jgi:hypothetical protein
MKRSTFHTNANCLSSCHLVGQYQVCFLYVDRATDSSRTSLKLLVIPQYRRQHNPSFPALNALKLQTVWYLAPECIHVSVGPVIELYILFPFEMPKKGALTTKNWDQDSFYNLFSLLL